MNDTPKPAVLERRVNAVCLTTREWRRDDRVVQLLNSAAADGTQHVGRVVESAAQDRVIHSGPLSLYSGVRS